MKVIVVILFFVVGNAITLTASRDLEGEWINFKTTYGKTYKSLIEEKQRKAIFTENYNFITEHNEKYQLGLESYTVRVNKFADTTVEERNILKGFKTSNQLRTLEKFASKIPADDLPESYDWREKGAVTKVKDQGDCGSCWAFSATGSVEAQHFIKTGKLIEISEQNLIDCSEFNWGCDGGHMYLAMDYIHENNGIDSEESYPYLADDTVECQYDVANNVTTLSGYVFLEEGNEDHLKEAVATIGPISVGIDAHQKSFDFYDNGIYAPRNCITESDYLNHAVLAIGYGTENGTDFWWVKNSWSEDWGIDGYIKMIRNDNNHCGIASACVYPTMY